MSSSENKEEKKKRQIAFRIISPLYAWALNLETSAISASSIIIITVKSRMVIKCECMRARIAKSN